jgi:hypothetical protein
MRLSTVSVAVVAVVVVVVVVVVRRRDVMVRRRPRSCGLQVGRLRPGTLEVPK